jgi:2-methylisocitrate lyase-like PEP mutase family enzyme
MLAELGFEALATSSGASAAVRGRKDGQLTRDEVLAHARDVVAATDLPVAADLENGFGEAPADIAATIRLAAEAGLVGGSIEDFTGDKAKPFYDLGLAVERIAAAAEAARALPFKFTLTARCEHFLRGHADLDATIGRLQAYEQAGADVLFAPALPDLESIRAVCAALTKPLNFMAGIPGKSFSVAALAGVGVKRISLATSLYRAAMKAAREAATEVRSTGSFGYIDRL